MPHEVGGSTSSVVSGDSGDACELGGATGAETAGVSVVLGV